MIKSQKNTHAYGNKDFVAKELLFAYLQYIFSNDLNIKLRKQFFRLQNACVVKSFARFVRREFNS